MNYQNIYDNIINKSRNRDLIGYSEKHHILPKCLGGANSKENIVKLTAKEHFICHKLLCYIFPDHKGLKIALWAMCNNRNNNNRYIPSSRSYEQAKIQHSIAMSELHKNKILTQETKDKIRNSNKNKSKPEGFNVGINRKGQGKGRIITWDIKSSDPNRCKKISNTFQNKTEEEKQNRRNKISESLKRRYSQSD